MTVQLLKALAKCPKTLAMDIGTGTKDVMLFSPENTIENNIKMVVPTPASLMADKIEVFSGDLRVSGYTMGGGWLAKVLKKHCKKGHKVQMELLPAFTVRNNIEEIKESGIEIVERASNPTHFFDEIELPFYFDLLGRYGVTTREIKVIGISVQDHGYNTNEESSRKNRFKYFLEHLNRATVPASLVFTPEDLPEVFGRLKSGVKAVSDFDPGLKLILIDTSFSAILGCPFDPRVAAISGPVLYINYGNGHTMACVIKDGRIQAFFEHHTRLIKENPGKMFDFMKRLVEGSLSSEEVFNDEGNGCVTFEPQQFSGISGVVVTGPRRHLMKESGIAPFLEAAPSGDMMMTGPLGVLRGLSMRLKEF